MKTLDNVLEEYTKKWRRYSWYYGDMSGLSDRRKTKRTRRGLLLDAAANRRWDEYYRWYHPIPRDETTEELLYTNKSWSEKIVNFICHYDYDFVFSHRGGRTLRYLFRNYVERADDIKKNKVKKTEIEKALSKLHKEDLVQLLMMKDVHLQDLSDRFLNYEIEYLKKEEDRLNAGRKMRAYRGLACLVLDMDTASVNEMLERVKNNKLTLQKALSSGGK